MHLLKCNVPNEDEDSSLNNSLNNSLLKIQFIKSCQLCIYISNANFQTIDSCDIIFVFQKVCIKFFLQPFLSYLRERSKDDAIIKSRNFHSHQ